MELHLGEATESAGQRRARNQWPVPAASPHLLDKSGGLQVPAAHSCACQNLLLAPAKILVGTLE